MVFFYDPLDLLNFIYIMCILSRGCETFDCRDCNKIEFNTFRENVRFQHKGLLLAFS